MIRSLEGKMTAVNRIRGVGRGSKFCGDRVIAGCTPSRPVVGALLTKL
jgi:hypothetical protein